MRRKSNQKNFKKDPELDQIMHYKPKCKNALNTHFIVIDAL